MGNYLKRVILTYLEKLQSLNYKAQSLWTSIAVYSSLCKLCFGKQYSVHIVKSCDRGRTVKQIWFGLQSSFLGVESFLTFDGAEKCHLSWHYLHLNGFLWLSTFSSYFSCLLFSFSEKCFIAFLKRTPKVFYLPVSCAFMTTLKNEQKDLECITNEREGEQVGIDVQQRWGLWEACEARSGKKQGEKWLCFA